ncbi:glycoside hydrolase family 61 protein [Bisporella sp. PMI_857]|nr:glycoside hydrolase family 61 protein [Bisporella sp. PMI_857]
MKFQNTFSLAAVFGVASSHSIFTQLTSGGTQYGIGEGVRVPSYDGPIQDVTSNYIACNGGPNPTTATSKVINVAAGSTVQATWRHTLQSGPEDVIDASHKGPVIAYLKKVGNATTDVGYGAGWFKVSEAGLNVAAQTWAVTDLIAAKGVQQIPIPACIASGQYLLRAELVALHSAGSSGGAQFYMECAQINITGGTGAKSPATVSLPGAYKASDPGITINIYQTLTSYTIPGPSVFKC